MNSDILSRKLQHFGFRYQCNVCGSWVRNMEPDGGREDFFKKSKAIGAGYREHVTCPVCWCNDRARFLDLCIRRYTSIYDEELSVLHFAPEKVISEKIRKNPKCSYTSGDISKRRAKKIVDIENICFSDDYFDWIICNYVLQYVDDAKALQEMKRVLKKDGKILLSVPIGRAMKKTVEFIPPKKIGESAYKRFYGKDTKSRLEKISGMRVKKITCRVGKWNRYGLINGDTVFILENKE